MNLLDLATPSYNITTKNGDKWWSQSKEQLQRTLLTLHRHNPRTVFYVIDNKTGLKQKVRFVQEKAGSK